MERQIIDNRLTGENALRQCQLTQLYLLEILDKICEKHEIVYFLDFGTLLGAMRHNGAIPWDDDLDISMPIRDYKRFVAIAPNELPKSVLLQTPFLNKGYGAPIARLRDRCSFYCEQGTCVEQPSGIFVDIYPIRKSPKYFPKIELFCHHVCKSAWSSICVYRTMPSETVVAMAIKLFKACLWSVVLFVVESFCKALYIFGFGGWSHPYPATSRPWRIPDDWIFPLKKHVYETSEFYIPSKPEKLLERYYSDWRKLPPEKHRNPYEKMKLILPTQSPKTWWSLPYEKS